MKRTTLATYWWSPRRQPVEHFRQFIAKRNAWQTAARDGGKPYYNFGDELSKLIVEQATGRRVSWAPPDKADLFAIGSILHHLPQHRRETTQIWGSGLRQPGLELPECANFLAVRGRLTATGLGLKSNTTLGDPGLITASLYRKYRNRNRKLAIPHFTVYQSRQGRKQLSQLRTANFEIIPPTMNVEQIINSIAHARIVMTSSLHGLIISHALGIPSRLLNFEIKSDPLFKYDDYYSLFDKKAVWANLKQLFSAPGEKSVEDDANKEIFELTAKIETIVESLLNAANPLR